METYPTYPTYPTDQEWRERLENKKVLKLLPELKEYLKTHLEKVEIVGQYQGHTCGFEHDDVYRPDWKPFQYTETFCNKHGLDWRWYLDVLRDVLKQPIECECELVNDREKQRRSRLRSHGVVEFDFSVIDF